MESTTITPQQTPRFLAGGGEMGRLIREYDWTSTPLGDPESWPQSLKTCIRLMLDSRQPIWIGWGREWIKFYNDPYLSIIGGKHPWALGKPASVVWKDIWADISPMLQQVEQGKGTYVESQLLIMERNGYPEETYYTFSYTPVLGDDGEIAGMFCANTDDTDRITGERQLKTLTRLGKRLTDCRNNQEIIEKTIATLEENPYDFPFAIFRMVKENTATLTRSTPLGDSAQLIPLEIDLNTTDFPVVQKLKKAITTRKPQVFEGVGMSLGQMPKGAWEKPADNVIALPIVQTGNKEPYGVLVVGLNPYRLLDEKYLGFFSLIADQIATSFTDVHAFEEERKRAESLAEIDRAKTTFFSNISHEFRTPLTLMLAPIQDVLSDPATIPENKLRMEVAHRNLQRLLKLVNTLLEFSRIEAGRMQARFESVNLSHLTKDLASIFRSAIEKAHMELVINCEENILAYVDIDMWEKVVLNLLSNAFKYTHSGTITVGLQQKGDRIEFSVADTGVGIPEAELEKVFERFHRIQSIGGRSQEGTGIGLALVQELVKLHQGEISVRSKVNTGTTFTVSIPNGKTHLPAEQINRELTDGQLSAAADIYLEEALKWLPENKAAEAISMAGAGETLPSRPGAKKRKLLLADDNIDMRDYLRRLLSASYEVTAVSNGREAFLSVQKAKPDLVLSDVMMPEMDGFELVKRLKENPATQNIPVILLSARAGEEATIEGLQTGADDYLVKPFSARELLSRIDSNIRIAQSRVMAFTQLYRLFMDAPVAIAILRGKEQRFELANQRYVDMAGKEELMGKSILEAFPELRDAGIKELLDQVYETGIPYTGNEMALEIVRRGIRETVYFNFVYSPMRDLDENIIGVMVFAIDVTDMVLARKVLEQNEERLGQEVEKRTDELKRINEALERSNKELEQYAFVTSHDLQEPLRKIQTFAHLFYERNAEALDEKSAAYCQKVIHAARRMSNLINDLLDFSRLYKQEPFTEVDLNEILKNAETDFELAIQEKQAQITAENLPKIEAVPLQMNQLFGNLLSNALKFSSRERKPLIRVKAKKLSPEETGLFPTLQKGRDYFKISFVDNGIGFDPAYAEKIFGIFQRLNDRSAYEGTGIGLASCSRIVANHQGIVYAESKEGKGASFHLILPSTQEHDQMNILQSRS